LAHPTRCSSKAPCVRRWLPPAWPTPEYQTTHRPADRSQPGGTWWRRRYRCSTCDTVRDLLSEQYIYIYIYTLYNTRRNRLNKPTAIRQAYKNTVMLIKIQRRKNTHTHIYTRQHASGHTPLSGLYKYNVVHTHTYITQEHASDRTPLSGL
jgi:hypothetical protein